MILSKLTQTGTNIKNKEYGCRSWKDWKKDLRNYIGWVI